MITKILLDDLQKRCNQFSILDYLMYEENRSFMTSLYMIKSFLDKFEDKILHDKKVSDEVWERVIKEHEKRNSDEAMP